ncbi:uncharacterized protein LOC108332762 [Vigna angularis]|uniref:uncharacterized protein LOC108332762 n=1 Tax=Phaseolus angularis TaxID=3914 RepID=UPI0022B322BB|nr:uncharacterized protein LOC108332762 [Vigna angularis]
MAFYTDNDPVICRAFSLSLKDEALEWYHTLDQNSVDCFATVGTLFRKQYATNRRPEMTPAELVKTKQEKDETLKAFMQRYNETARCVKDVNHTFIINNLPSCLRPGYFPEQLYADPPKSMEELQATIAKFIRIEDLRNSRKRQQLESPNNGTKKDTKRSSNDYKADKPPRKEAKVLEEALHAELLTVRRKATPKNADGSKACRLNLNLGHDTEECNIVKDEIERLIRAGYLQKYIKERTSTRAATPSRKETSRRSPERSPHRDDRRRRRSRSQPRHPERERSVQGRIDTISGGFAGGGASASARKRHLRNLKAVHMVDRHAVDPDHDDPMVITAEIARYDVKKVLIDQGSSVNILYWTTFLKMDLSEDLIAPFNEQIVGFVGERVDTRGYLDLRTRLGTGREARELRVRFLLVEANTSYNALVGRPCLNAFGGIVSTRHLAMKLPTERGTVCTVRADQRTTRQCYVAGLKVTPFMPPRRARGAETAAIDLDPRTNIDDHLHPQGDLKTFQLGADASKTTTIGGSLEPHDEHDLTKILKSNADLFAWVATDMMGIHPGVMTHKLSIFKEACPIAQRNGYSGKKNERPYKQKSTN